MKVSLLVASSVLSLLSTMEVEARTFNEQDAFISYIKLSDVSDLGSYLPEYRNVFQSYKWKNDNEFDGVTEDDRAIARFKKNISSFDMKESFELPVAVSFGEYQFDTKSFNFHPFSAASSFSAGRYQVSFINTRKFDGLPMDQEKAKAFLAQHPNRTISVNVSFVPTTAVEDSKKIKAKITSIEVYSDDRQQNLIARFTDD